MAETEAPHLTVDEAMIEVMREIGPVGKNGRNTKQNYEFRAYDDIVAAARGPMAKYGLRMLPEVIDQKHFVRNERMNVAILTVRYRMRGPGGDEMDTPIVVVGEGADVADKASNKAMTAAKKYAYMQAFEISDDADDGDRDHPVAARGPLDWYIEQIQQYNVWHNANALRDLRDRAVAAGVANLHMPDGTGVTFRQAVEAQGRKLITQHQEREQRQTQERQAAQAQMMAEYPDPPDPYNDAWDQVTHQHPAHSQQYAPPAPQSSASPPQNRSELPPPPSAPSALPDPEAIEEQLAGAVADPATAEQRLHTLRTQYGAGTLAQVVVRSEWGTVDANSAITMALMSKDATARQSDAEPVSTADAQAAPVAPRPAKRTTGMTAEQRAQANMIAEAEFQAQMLGTPTLEFVADLLPPGASGIEDIKGGSRLQDHIRQNRGVVLEAIREQGMVQAADAYAKFGDRVPVPNFNQFITGVLQAR